MNREEQIANDAATLVALESNLHDDVSTLNGYLGSQKSAGSDMDYVRPITMGLKQVEELYSKYPNNSFFEEKYRAIHMQFKKSFYSDLGKQFAQEHFKDYL